MFDRDTNLRLYNSLKQPCKEIEIFLHTLKAQVEVKVSVAGSSPAESEGHPSTLFYFINFGDDGCVLEKLGSALENVTSCDCINRDIINEKMLRSVECATLGRRLMMSSCAWMRYQATVNISTTRGAHQDHYETLGISKDCTAVEIKEAFIKLSKELHPDKDLSSPNLHKRFVEVNEAYSVLSRPHLRQNYDLELKLKERPDMYEYGGIRTNAPRRNVVYGDPSIWENRDRSEDQKYESKPYYGVRGINKKLPNSYIAAGAVIFMLVGAIFHFFIAKVSTDFALDHLDRRDQEASRHHFLAKERAKANGTELQIALMKEHIEANNRRRMGQTVPSD